MKSFAKAILFALSLGFIAPACLVRAEPDDGYDSVTVGYHSAPRCAANRYWNGSRCERVRRVHYYPQRRYYWHHYD